MVLEGDRLVEDALLGGFEPEPVLLAASRRERAGELAARGASVRLVSDALLAGLSRLRTPPGILALVRVPEPRLLAGLPAEDDALVVVACGLQDPGNLGALARTAEAAGCAALVVAGAAGCRPWNEKALRGSMGSLLRLPTFEVEDERTAWDALVGAGYRPVVARTRGGAEPRELDWSGRVALWLSAETGELPQAIEGRAGEALGVTIPIARGVESLNATIAAAVLLFAAGRTGGGRA